MFKPSAWSLVSLVGLTSACGGVSFSAARQAAVSASPQFNGEKFENVLPRVRSGFSDVLKKTFSAPDTTVPEVQLPLQKRTGSEYAEGPASGLRVTWLGHSTVLLEIDGQRVLIDPIWSERASPFSWMGPARFYEPPLPLHELPPIDVVVISHDHYDHLDEETIKQLKGRVGQFVVPLGVGQYLEDWGIEAERIRDVDWWDEVEVGGLKLVCTPARHFSGRRVSLDLFQDKTLWAGWAIIGPKHRVFYSGDTAMVDSFAEVGKRYGPFDLSLVETGAYDALWSDVHLGPEQAAQVHLLVRAKVMMPVHWGTFDLANHGWTEPVERLLDAAKAHRIKVVVPRPGDRFEPATAPALSRWWPELEYKSSREDPVVSSHLGRRIQRLVRARRVP